MDYQPSLFDQPPKPPRFNGSDYEPARDDARLTGQLQRIWDVMVDGQWRTLAQISKEADAPAASVSAQLRHLRKPRFGGHTVEKEHLGRGLFQYRLIPNERANSCGNS